MEERYLGKGIYKKLAMYSFLIAFTLSIVISFIQIIFDYKSQHSEIQNKIDDLVSVVKPSAEKAIFEFDEKLGEIVLNSLFEHELILEVTITDDYGDTFTSERRKEASKRSDWLPNSLPFQPYTKTYSLDVKSQANSPKSEIALEIDPYISFNSFFQRSWIEIFSGLIRNIILTLLFLLLCYKLVTKPITNIANRLVSVNPFDDKLAAIPLDKANENDELGYLTLKINSIFKTIQTGISDIKRLNSKLSHEVSERKQIENVLNYAEQNTSGLTGTEYSNSMVKFLSKSLSLKGTLVAYFDNDSFLVKSSYFIETSIATTFLNNFNLEQDLKSNDFLYINQDSITSYFDGYPALLIPLKARSQNTIGILVLLNEDSFEENFFQQHKALLQIYSSRIATEIERERQQRNIESLAHQDTLTGLDNRYYFHRKINQQIQQCKDANGQLALLYMDLDRFKWVNDSFGHRVGDLLLQKVAKRLSKVLQGKYSLARIGGDEFALLVDIKNPNDEFVVAKSIQDTLQIPFSIENRVISTRCSIGISMYPKSAVDAEELLKNADMAMYLAKKSPDPRIEYYSEIFNTKVKRKIILEAALSQAIKNSELYLLYQPQYELPSNKLIGVEALVRWKDATLGNVTPDEFIPIAEETGLIHKLGDWVFMEASKQSKYWNEQLDSDIRISINISGYQLKSPLMFNSLYSNIQNAGVKPELLTLEITETALIENIDTTAILLQQLTELGIKISIDDFGTGYSSLRYLKSLPLHYLKIDKAFISGIPQSANDMHIVQAVIALAKAMELEVFAEGVETNLQAEKITSLGCGYAQGYLYSKPVTAEDINQLLQNTPQTP